MLPELRPKKGNSLQKSSSSTLLQKQLQLQNGLLSRSEQRDSALISLMERLSTSVASLQRGFAHFQEELLTSSAQTVALLGKMVKLQSGTVKAERNALFQLEEMNKKGGLSRSKREGEGRMGHSEQVRVSIQPSEKVVTEKGDNTFEKSHQNAAILQQLKIEQGAFEKGLKQEAKENINKALIKENYLVNDISQIGKFGQFRDKEVIIPLNGSIEGRPVPSTESLEGVEQHITQWLGYTFDFITKQAFAGYCTKKMLQSETKIYLCNNIILNFHNMISWIIKEFPKYWEEHSNNFVNLFEVNSSKTLSFQLIKYPQKQKIFISSDLQNLIPTKNESDNPENSIPGNMKLFFQQSQDGNFFKSIKLFLNGIIKQSQKSFPGFKDLLRKVFTIRGESNTQYVVSHLIGMKLKDNMPLFTQKQIESNGIPIKAPEILRIIIKWIQQLEQIIEKSDKKIQARKYPYVNRSDGAPILLSSRFQSRLSRSMKDYYETSFGDVDSLHSSILHSTFSNLPEFIDLYRGSLSFLPLNSIRTGLTVSLLSQISSDMAVQRLNKLMVYLMERVNRCYKENMPVESQSYKFKIEDFEFIPFSVGDLLRAKCSGKLNEIKEVLANIQNNKDITLVRVKNRLETSNRDFLLNLKFKGCPLICQLQVGLKDSGDDKQSYLDHYNHLLYELRRSKYGPVSESVLIISNSTEIGSYFNTILQKETNNKNRINFNGANGQEPLKDQMKSDFTFLCSNCMKLSKAFSTYLPCYKLRTSDAFICGHCIYKQANATERANIIFGKGLGNFFEQFTYNYNDKTPLSQLILAVPKGNSLDLQMVTLRYLQRIFPERKIYHCFRDLSEFYDLQSIQNNLLFRLRKQIILLPLNLNMPMNQQLIKVKLQDLLVDPSEASKFPAGFMEKTCQLVFMVKKTDLSKKIIKQGRCAINPEQRLIIVFNEHFEKQVVDKAFKHWRHQQILNRLLNRNELQWILSRLGFTAEQFKNIIPNKNLEWLYLEHSQFKTLNFLKSQSLSLLQMSVNEITSIDFGNNFPNLRQLILMSNKITNLNGLEGCPLLRKLHIMRNQIEIVDLSQINIPNLIELDVSTNPIKKIVGGNKVFLPKLQRFLIGSDFNITHLVQLKFQDVFLPQLKFLCIRRCDLRQVSIRSINFPKLTYLQIDYNSELTSLNLSDIHTLEILEAHNCGLNQIVFSKQSKLKDINLRYNYFEYFNLSGIKAAELKKIDIGFNKLVQINIPENLESLQQIFLDSNMLTSIAFLGVLPSIAKINLSYNFIKHLDLSKVGILDKLQTLQIKCCDFSKVTFCQQVFLQSLSDIKVQNNAQIMENIPSNIEITLSQLKKLKCFSAGKHYSLEYFERTMRRVVDQPTAQKLIEYAKNNPIMVIYDKKEVSKFVSENDIREYLQKKPLDYFDNALQVLQVYANFLQVNQVGSKNAQNLIQKYKKRDPTSIIIFKQINEPRLQ